MQIEIWRNNTRYDSCGNIIKISINPPYPPLPRRKLLCNLMNCLDTSLTIPSILKEEHEAINKECKKPMGYGCCEGRNQYWKYLLKTNH